MKASRIIKEFLFPPVCLSCGMNLKKEEGWLCPACRTEFAAAYEPRFFLCRGGNGYADSMFSLFSYRSVAVRSYLFSYKRAAFEGNGAIFEEFGAPALSAMPFLEKADLVCFTPRSRQNRLRRGVDQAEEMAKVFSRFSGLPFEDLLLRRGFSFSQHRLKGERRARNVRGRFSTRRPILWENVVLIDDIVTTGATASAAARALKAAGAAHVYVLCFAH